VLRRTVEETCAIYGRAQVEIGDVIQLAYPHYAKDGSREVRILESARQALGAFDILFIHADGGASPDRARDERIAPAVRRIAEELAAGAGRAVAVVPVRETEAWASVDGDALRRALGAKVSDLELGVPVRAVDVEGIGLPKEALERAFREVVGRHRRHPKRAAEFLDIIGERVALSRLREVPAFRMLESDTRMALIELQYINEPGSAGRRQ
jgi:hypothetical protein